MNLDLESVYDEEINPLMAQILAVCKRHKMPMVASFQYGPDDFCTSALLSDEYEPHECLTKALSVIQPAAAAMFRLTTRNADGLIIRDEVIVP